MDALRGFLKTIFVLVLGGWLSSGHAAIRYVFDFDGTLVNDQGEEAAWRTDWILVRTDQRHSALQANPAGKIPLYIPTAGGGTEIIEVLHPEILPVPYGEYRRLRGLLAQKNGMLGALDPRKPFRLRRDPLRPDMPEWILPGLYRVEESITFDRYQTVGREFKKPPVVEDFLEAEKREEITADSAQPLRWQGPAFKHLQAAVRDPARLKSMAINTARGLSRDQMNALFSQWVKRGLLENHPEKLGYTLHAAGDPGLMPVLGKGSVEQMKVEAIRKEALQLLKAPITPHWEEASSPRALENGERELRHTLLVEEDDPIHAANIGTLMADLSMRADYKFKIKFVLRQVGPQADRSARWPWEYTVLFDGRGRQATPGEIARWDSGDDQGDGCNADLSTANGGRP